ncbi:MAG: AAA family ATPase [Acidimicrobiales bacterium]
MIPTAEHVSLTSWEPVDLRPVLAGEQVTQPPSVLEREDGVRLLYGGRLNLFAGETESLKSWCWQLAATQELKAGQHVIVIDFEDTPEGTVERLRSLGASAEQIEAHLTFIQPESRFDELAEEVIRDYIAQRGAPTLVVIDGVTEAMSQIGLDPTKGPDVAAFFASYPTRFARTGAAVVLVDHVTKSTENRGRWAIGSERKLSGLTGAAYMFDVLSPFGRGRTGKAKLTVAKDRCGHVRQHEGSGRVIALLELRSWPDGGVTASLAAPEPVSEGPFRPTGVMEQLSAMVAETPGMGVKQLRAAVRCKASTTDLALEILVNEGYVTVEPGPNRLKRHVSVRPFLAHDPGNDDASF